LSALSKDLIHLAGVVAHNLRELIPLLLLGRRDFQLRMQLGNAALDTFLGALERRRRSRGNRS
jgi:hypothetical protein